MTLFDGACKAMQSVAGGLAVLSSPSLFREHNLLPESNKSPFLVADGGQVSFLSKLDELRLGLRVDPNATFLSGEERNGLDLLLAAEACRGSYGHQPSFGFPC